MTLVESSLVAHLEYPGSQVGGGFLAPQKIYYCWCYIDLHQHRCFVRRRYFSLKYRFLDAWNQEGKKTVRKNGTFELDPLKRGTHVIPFASVFSAKTEVSSKTLIVAKGLRHFHRLEYICTYASVISLSLFPHVSLFGNSTRTRLWWNGVGERIPKRRFGRGYMYMEVPSGLGDTKNPNQV